MDWSIIPWSLGSLVILYSSFQLLIGSIYYLYGYLSTNSLDFKKFGKYACITGCTDGIGKAYCYEFAKRKMDLVLISRSQEKLNSMANDLRSKYAVEVIVIIADFTRSDIYTELASKLMQFDIAVLINNVGMSAGTPKYFSEYNYKFVCDIINCNFGSAALMCRIILPHFISKRKGILINVSSAAAFIPAVMSVPYGATKAAEQKLTEGLQAELALVSHDIIIQDVAPCFVATKLSNQKAVPYHIPTAEEYVKSAIVTIGRFPFTAGSLCHQIEHYILKACPIFILAPLVLKRKLSILSERN